MRNDLPMHLRLNPDLNLAPFTAAYARDGFVQIPDVLAPDVAEALLTHLHTKTPWRLLHVDADARPVHHGLDEVRAKGREWYTATINAALAQARESVGYLYCTYPMIDFYLQGRDPDNDIHRVTEFLNADDWLSLGRTVLGNPNVSKAEAHAARYDPGHFLTRHVDFGDNGARRAAYVISLCKDWRPDWGGLLLFLDARQNVSEGYLPRFNVVTIFDVGRVHAVSQVANFAGAARYSIAGWFRDDPARPVH